MRFLPLPVSKASDSSSPSLYSTSESGVEKDITDALTEEGLRASREIGKSGKIALIYLIMWLQRVLSSSLDSSTKLGI